LTFDFWPLFFILWPLVPNALRLFITETPGILDLSFAFRAIPHQLRYIEKYDGKDILFLTEKSKRPGKVRQGVAGKWIMRE
jgi:hypothetical protein